MIAVEIEQCSELRNIDIGGSPFMKPGSNYTHYRRNNIYNLLSCGSDHLCHFISLSNNFKT